MTSAGNNPPNGKPLGEEQLLDWIDGRLNETDQSRLADSSGRAGLHERVRQMQANKRALGSLAPVKAPPELMERVLATLERDALLGLAKGEAVEEHPPILISTRAASGRWSRAVPGLALAAGLVLLVTGGVYWSSLLFTPGPKPAVGPIARTDHAETPLPAPATEPAPIATASRGMTEPSAMKAADAAAPAGATSELATTAAAESVSVDRAVELAREGRLVMRVESKNTRGLTSLEAMGNGRGARAWRLRKDVPAAVTASVLAASTATAPSDFVGPVMAASHPTNVASLLAPLVGPRAAYNVAPPRVTSRGAEIVGTYLLDLPANAASLQSLATTFADKLQGGVRFEELPEPADAPALSDPESLLWWTQPPPQWAPRATVPVVVEEPN